MIDATLAIAAIPAVVTFIAGWAVNRHLVSKKTLSHVLTYAQWAVLAAEEAYKTVPESGSDKFAHAMNALQAKTGISAQEAETVILSSVNSLRRAGLLGKKTDGPEGSVVFLNPNDPSAS